MRKLILLLFLIPNFLNAQISLIKYKGKCPVNFQLLGEFYTVDHIIFNENNSPTTSREFGHPVFYEENQTQFPLIVFPNDRLTIESNGNTFSIHSDSPTRENELNCTSELYHLYDTFIFDDNPLAQDHIPVITEQIRLSYPKRDKEYFNTFKKHLPKMPVSNQQRDSLIYDIFQKRVNFINTFSQKKIISPQYVSTLTTYLLYRYLYLSIRGFEYSKQAKLTDRLRNYVNNKNTFNDSLLSTFISYSAFLWTYNKYLTSIKLQRNGTEVEQLLNADTSFSGRSRDKIMFALVNENLTGKKHNDTLINNFLRKCHTPEYLENIKHRILLVDIVKNNQADLMDAEENFYTINEILNAQSGHYVYLDFWASWCIPCNNEMKYSQALSQKYKDISFVYISLDQDKPSWQSMITNYKNFIKPGNSFLLLSKINSQFVSDYNISTIPRYMLIGKDGKIINANALRPSDPKLKELLNKYINTK